MFLTQLTEGSYLESSSSTNGSNHSQKNYFVFVLQSMEERQIEEVVTSESCFV